MAEVRKTAKYYREILNGNDIYKSLAVIPEIIKKFGFVDKYRSEINFDRKVVSENFNWNHSIEGFDLAKDGTLYAKVYWQGDSTDGTKYVKASYLIGGYTINAEWDEVGGSWGMVCKHSPLEINNAEIHKAVKAIIPLLSAELIKARKKRLANEPYVMPMYKRINTFMEDYHPYNRWASDEIREKHNNGECAVRNLMIDDAKMFMDMDERECRKIMEKIFVQNYKVNKEFNKNADGNRIYNMSY